jgi:hypothetical protein
MSFVIDCLKGKVDLSGIDGYIDKWHAGESIKPLYEYLGMTSEEYDLWVEDQTALQNIVNAHRKA